MEGSGVGVGWVPGIKLHPAMEMMSKLTVRGRIFAFMGSSFELGSSSVRPYVRITFRRAWSREKMAFPSSTD
jgi:hypothetical protein